MINSGYVFFIPKSKPKTLGGIFSKLTGVFTQKKSLPLLAHCGIMINSHRMIHAWSIIKHDNVEDIAKTYDGYIVSRCTCKNYNHDKAIEYATKQLGNLYDVLGLLGTVKYYLWDKYSSKSTINKYDKTKMQWCSELVLDSLKSGGCENAIKFKDGFESPADIADFSCMSRLRIK